MQATEIGGRVKQRIEIHVCHEDGGWWNLLDEDGPDPAIVVDTEVRDKLWLAAISYTKSMYHDIAARACYADVVQLEIWTAGVLGQRLYAYGRNGETFEDPQDTGEEDVA